MKRRALLAGGSIVAGGGLVGVFSRVNGNLQNGPDTRHFSSAVWGEEERVPDNRIFENQDTALEKRLDTDEGAEFEAFVRKTDFNSEWVVLVQEIGTGAGNELTLREKQRGEEKIKLVIDEWPPEDDEIRPAAIFMHAIAARGTTDDRGGPSDVEVTIHRHDDRWVIGRLLDRSHYW